MIEDPMFKVSPQAIANGINDLLDELEEEKRINKEDLKLIDDLQNKIDEAIEYIENNSELYYGDELYDEYQKIVDILKGEDNDNSSNNI